MSIQHLDDRRTSPPSFSSTGVFFGNRVPQLALALLLAACSSSSPAGDGGSGATPTAGGSTNAAGSANAGDTSLAGGGSAAGGDESGGTGGAGPVEELEYSPCALGTAIGVFRIQLEEEFTGVSGTVRSGVVPGDVPELVMESAECRLLTDRNLFCDPPCGASKTCDTDGECIDYPTSQDVGTVTIDGLKIPLSIMPSATGFYTNPAQPPLPHPGFDAGAAIALSAEGGVLEPFDLRGQGVSTIALENAPLSVSSGQGLTVEWSAGTVAEAQRVFLRLEFNRHGGTPTWIECDAPDTGSYTIPEPLVSELLELEVSGWPMLTATRRTVDSAELAAGCVELQVTASVADFVEVEGVVSCDDAHPCPNDEVCQVNLTCP